MTRSQRIRRRLMMLFWRVANPPARWLAGIAPWWVVLETTGRRSGKPRHTPLARGPEWEGAHWLIAVHGRHSAWVRNLIAEPSVRLRVHGRWLTGSASIVEFDPQIASRFSLYAQSGPRLAGIDPLLVRVTPSDLDRSRTAQ